MKPIPVNTFVDITVEDLAKSITSEELGDLFCELCKYESQRSFTDRRRVIGQIADGLHEDAIRMLGEVVALAYHRVRNEFGTVVPMPVSPSSRTLSEGEVSDIPF